MQRPVQKDRAREAVKLASKLSPVDPFQGQFVTFLRFLLSDAGFLCSDAGVLCSDAGFLRQNHGFCAEISNSGAQIADLVNDFIDLYRRGPKSTNVFLINEFLNEIFDARFLSDSVGVIF